MRQKSKKICPECRLMGDKTRAKIVSRLKGGPKNVSEIVKVFRLRQPTISHHLKVLEKRGLVLSKKEGRQTYYFLNKNHPCVIC